METKGNKTKNNDAPIFVDLDGTLVLIDTLWESVVALLKQNPLILFYFPLWLLKGKAYFKSKVASRIILAPESIPYNTEVLDFLRTEHMKGRHIVLATAADYQIAKKIADHLGIFSAVLSSNGEVNLSGERKLHAIKKYSGKTEFEYIGNTAIDLPVWKASRQAHIVKPSKNLLSTVKESTLLATYLGLLRADGLHILEHSVSISGQRIFCYLYR